jgi:CheY-like chemotaxis protein
VVIDIQMPSLDGYGVARLIRDRYDDRKPRLVALTGFGSPASKVLALAAGFDEHIAKAADPEVLRRAVEAMASDRGDYGPVIRATAAVSQDK